MPAPSPATNRPNTSRPIPFADVWKLQDSQSPARQMDRMNVHGTQHPYQCRNLYGRSPGHPVSNEERGERAKKRTAGHGACDEALTVATMDVEVIGISTGGQNAAH